MEGNNTIYQNTHTILDLKISKLYTVAFCETWSIHFKLGDCNEEYEISERNMLSTKIYYT